MRPIRFFAPGLLAALLLVACGGGDPTEPGTGSPSGAPTTKGGFTSIVSFGDSLSDLGTYTPATSVTGDGNPPFIGGKWTTNSATGTVWVENVATALSTQATPIIVTPAEVGFGTQSAKCPAAANPLLANTCTGYGQGGSRITDPNGIGHTDLTTGAVRALTVPIKAQIANHLARFGNFKSTDLVFVWAGGNDFLFQVSQDPRENPNSFFVKAAQIQAQAQAGAITADQAQGLLFQAQLASQEAMKQAALELAGYIRTEILGKGAKYVAVMNFPNPASTPSGAATAAANPAAGALLTTLADTFNLWLREGLTGQPVMIVDLRTLFTSVVATPATFGIANATVPACDAAKIATLTHDQVTDGKSLFCNVTPNSPLNALRDGADPLTWFFADGNHPSTGGHKVLSDNIIKQMQAAGWI